MNNWPEFYFSRHGETDWNREGRYQGSRDIPLNTLGQSQADANGILLRRIFDEKNIDPTKINWYASPLSRASETMQRMRAAFDVTLSDVKYDDRLKEISFGILEGRLHSEIDDENPVSPGNRPADYWDFRPREGENYQDLSDRLLDFQGDMEGLPVVVAHGGILRALRHLVEGVSKVDIVNWHPPQGTVAHFENSQMTMHEAMKPA